MLLSSENQNWITLYAAPTSFPSLDGIIVQNSGMVFTLDEYNRANVIKKIGQFFFFNEIISKIKKNLQHTAMSQFGCGRELQQEHIHYECFVVVVVDENL